jgi:hypothetical protein
MLSSRLFFTLTEEGEEGMALLEENGGIPEEGGGLTEENNPFKELEEEGEVPNLLEVENDVFLETLFFIFILSTIIEITLKLISRSYAIRLWCYFFIRSPRR